MTEDERKALELMRLEPGGFLWRRANDEHCACGHMRTQHEDTLSWGHGDCHVEDCTCMKFTWTKPTEN